MRISLNGVCINYPRGGEPKAQKLIYSLPPQKTIFSSKLGHFRPKFGPRGGGIFLFFYNIVAKGVGALA